MIPESGSLDRSDHGRCRSLEGEQIELDIQSLLEPVSEEVPSGEDLEYEPEFGSLERAAKRVPEQESGGATIEVWNPMGARYAKRRSLTSFLESAPPRSTCVKR